MSYALFRLPLYAQQWEWDSQMQSNKTTRLDPGTIRTRSRPPSLLKRSLPVHASYPGVDLWSLLSPRSLSFHQLTIEAECALLLVSRSHRCVCGQSCLPHTARHPCSLLLLMHHLCGGGFLWSCAARNWIQTSALQSPLFLSWTSPLGNKPTQGLPKLSIHSDRDVVGIKFSTLWGRLVWAWQQFINNSG